MEDYLNVNIPPFPEIKIKIYPQEFLCQNRNIKFDSIVSGKVAPFKKRSKLFSYLPEGRCICDIFIFNPMNSGGFRRNNHFGIYPGAHPLLFTIGTDLQDRDFNNTVS